LKNCYQTIGLAHYYQLWTTLINIKQEPGQSVNDFLAQVQPIWHQISSAKINEDHLHLIQVLMDLRPEYEVVRASLLHRNPLPSLDTAIQEIIFEETRLNLAKLLKWMLLLKLLDSHTRKSSHHPCKNCNRTGHVFDNCPTIECRYCHGIGHILENCPMRPPKQNHGFTKSKNIPKSGSSSISAAATEGSTAITMSDIEALIKQVISSNTSTAMSTTHGNSRWFFYFACCNHMTTDIKSLPSATFVSSLPPIHTASGNTMNITHIGHVSTSNLTLPDTYYIPNLTLNLISVGQLYEQGMNVYFST